MGQKRQGFYSELTEKGGVGVSADVANFIGKYKRELRMEFSE